MNCDSGSSSCKSTFLLKNTSKIVGGLSPALNGSFLRSTGKRRPGHLVATLAVITAFCLPVTLAAQSEAYVNTGLRNVRIEPSASAFSGLSANERSIVAFAMISRNEGTLSRRSAVLDALNALPDKDAWREAAALYFDGSAAARAARLSVLAARQGASSPAAQLLLLEKPGAPPSPESLSGFGPALESAYAARRMLDESPKTAADIQRLLILLELSLSDAGDIPFADRLLADLPDRLDAAGLSLEAAILARAIQRQRPIKELEKKVPAYLLRAGDFHGALKTSESLDPMIYRNTRRAIQAMDWMILASDYRKALEIHSKYLAEARPIGDDAFSGFELSRSLLRTRSAVLLYLLGDSKEALLSLDAQTKSKKFDIDVGYARLLQAQLLFEENMDLSRQIAEDLTYRAQESSLYLLEYHATVLEGLTLQRQGKDYMAWINFVKARGIAASHLKNPPTGALALGQMLAGLKLTPGGSFKAFMAEILAAEDATAEHEAMQLLRFGMPARHRPLLWKKALLENLTARKLKGEIVEALQSFLERPSVHGASANPGGLTGLADVRLWNLQPSGISPVSLSLQKNTALREKSKAQMSASLADGVVFLIYSKQEALFVHLSGEPLSMKSGFISLSCLAGEQGGACQEAIKPLLDALATSKTVYFQAGSLPAFSLVTSPQRLDWRVVHAPDMIAVNAASDGGAYRLCSSADLSERRAKTISGIREWKGSVLLLGAFQSRSATSPVYLSQIRCNSEPRLWDLDRFVSIPAQSRWISPLTSTGEAELARLLTRSGADWIQYDEKEADDDLLEELIEGERPEGRYRVVKASFAE